MNSYKPPKNLIISCVSVAGLLLAAYWWWPGSRPVAGHLAGGKPVGLFLMTLNHAYTASYYFSPNGGAYQNPTGLNYGALKQASSRYGDYRVAGKTLRIAWLKSPPNYVEVDSGELRVLADGFSWGGRGVFSAVGPFSRPSQLVGTFVGNDSAYLSDTYQSVRYQALSFRADSTYYGSGLDTAAVAARRTLATASSTPQQAGRWQLDGWYLTLTDAQGQATQGVAYPIETDDKTDQITRFYFANMVYKHL